MVQQRLCLTCERPFDVPPTSKRRFCSSECTPANAPRQRRPPVRVPCGRCGKTFERGAAEVEQRRKRGWALYCSTECRDAAKRGRKGQRVKESVSLICPKCGTTFEVSPPSEASRRKYCSRSCAGQEGGSHRRKLGDRYSTSDGYVSVFVVPQERPAGREKIAYYLEHRYVMFKSLGRWPGQHESVHHINGDKADNRLENLQLRSGSHGRGQILRCRCCGSSDIESVEL